MLSSWARRSEVWIPWFKCACADCSVPVETRSMDDLVETADATAARTGTECDAAAGSGGLSTNALVGAAAALIGIFAR
jgi:hypothetical protein